MNSMCFSPSWDEPKRWRKKRASWWITFLVALIICVVAIALMIPAVGAFIGPVVATYSSVIFATACISGTVALVSGVTIAIEKHNGTDARANALARAEDSVNNDAKLSEDEKTRIVNALNNTVEGSVDDNLSIIPDEFNPLSQSSKFLRSGFKWFIGLAAAGCAVAGGYYLMTKSDYNNNNGDLQQ